MDGTYVLMGVERMNEIPHASVQLLVTRPYPEGHKSTRGVAPAAWVRRELKAGEIADLGLLQQDTHSIN